jgi:NAD(P)H-flavin reductase
VPAHLLYSSRSLDDVINREKLDQLAARTDGLVVTHTVTRRQPPGWHGYAPNLIRPNASGRQANAPTT